MAREEDRMLRPDWSFYKNRSLLTPGFDVRDAIHKKATADIARGMDDIIAKAILLASGQEWTLVNIPARMKSERYVGQTFQTIFLDGEPILELHDGTFDLKHDQTSSFIHYNQNYRFLGKAADGAMRPSKTIEDTK